MPKQPVKRTGPGKKPKAKKGADKKTTVKKKVYKYTPNPKKAAARKKSVGKSFDGVLAARDLPKGTSKVGKLKTVHMTDGQYKTFQNKRKRAAGELPGNNYKKKSTLYKTVSRGNSSYESLTGKVNPATGKRYKSIKQKPGEDLHAFQRRRAGGIKTTQKQRDAANKKSVVKSVNKKVGSQNVVAKRKKSK